MAALAALSRLPFVPAGPLLLDAVNERLASVAYFVRTKTIVNAAHNARPVLTVELTTFYGAERAAALLGPLLVKASITHDGARWLVAGPVAGSWS